MPRIITRCEDCGGLVHSHEVSALQIGAEFQRACSAIDRGDRDEHDTKFLYGHEGQGLEVITYYRGHCRDCAAREEEALERIFGFSLEE